MERFLKKKVLLVLTGLVLAVGLILVSGRGRWPDGDTSSEAGPALHANTALARENSDDEEGDGPPSDGPVSLRSYDLSAHQTLSRVILLIRENYVEPERIKPYEMFLAALDYIQKTVPEVMVDETGAPARIVVSVGSARESFEPGSLSQLWEVTMALRDIFRFLQGRITDPLQRRDIEYAAINGMLSTLDPHSVLMKPEYFDEMKLSTKGEFGGLGIVISIRDGLLTVISPIEGTPAARAGLRAKDRIVKIGEESTVSMALDEAVGRLRGHAGSKVTIGVQRKSWTEPRKFVLTRAVIKIESVSSKLLADGIGYVKLKSFQTNTFSDLQQHLEKLRVANNSTELKGLVLDMRNNPGGLLDQAILISDRFIERGPLVITVGEGNRKREVKSAHFSGNENIYPIAVLLNGGSASASEIVAGALKNHDRAFIIGQQSFGKGSVQVLYDFKDRSALKLTIAQYLTPGDISIQSVGITPDVTIVPAVVEQEGLHLFVDDDAPREKDLEKHLDQRGSMSQVTASEIKIIHLMPREREGQEAKEAKEAKEGGEAKGPAAPSLTAIGHASEAKESPEGKVPKPASGHGKGAPTVAGEDEDPLPEAFEYDFETQLAHDVVLQAQSTNRQAILKGATELFRARAAEQESIVAARLSEFKVDWSLGPAQGLPRAEANLKVAGVDSRVVAGQNLILTGSVRNLGDAPMYRVYGVTSSDNPMLKNLELAFGKIMPGETRSWELKIKVPGDMMARTDSVSLGLGDAYGITKNVRGETLVTFEEQKAPRFACSVRVDDRAHGNGDGVLQADEQASLVVDVQNLGPGVAEEVNLQVKNLAGKAVFLDQGRAKVGKIGVGESRSGSLNFSVKEAHDRVGFKITAWDMNLGGPVSKTLQIPVLPGRRAKLDARVLQAGAADVPIFAGASADSLRLAVLQAGGQVASDASFGDWLRIEAGPGMVGFVRQADVTVAPAAGRKLRAGGKKMASADVRLKPPLLAPEIELALPSLVMSGDHMVLTGRVRDDDRLKDLFVFVNDKKVYYRALEEVPRDTDGKISAEIKVKVPLKPGANTVAVVAREDDDLMTRRMFGVFCSMPAASPSTATATKVPAATH